MAEDTRDAIAKIVAAERKREKRKKERIDRRLPEARLEADRIAARLVAADADVRKIILFGSVATGSVRSEQFDIDLAIEGGNHLSLMRIAEESPFSVDLVDLEAVSERFRHAVEAKGIVLYDARL